MYVLNFRRNSSNEKRVIDNKSEIIWTKAALHQ